MPSMQEIRQKYPQYDDMSDQEFADKFHDKFYSDMPKEEFYKKLSFSPKVEEKKQPESLLQKSNRYAQQYINEPIEEFGNELLHAGAGAGQGVANVGVGVRNILANLANLVPGVNIPQEKSIDFVPHNINTLAGELGGNIIGGGGVARGTSLIASHLSDIPKIANELKKASSIIGKSPFAVQKFLGSLKPASKNALVGAAVAPEDQGIGAALGAGGSLLGSAASAGIPKLMSKFGIGVQPGANVTSYIKPEDVRESFEAGERLGRTLTPAEASRNPFVGGKESSFKRTEKGSFQNVEEGLKKQKQEKKAINNLLNTIHSNTPESNNKIKQLYKQVERWNIKPNIFNELKQDPLIKNAIEEVSNNPAWQRNLGNSPENSVKYLDRVKRALYNKEKGLRRNGYSTEAEEYKDARNNLVNMMDEVAPGYKEARKLSELKSTRKEIKKKMKKEEITGSAFFNKIINNDEEYYNSLLKKLRNKPEAKEMLEDMRKSWHSLINLKTVAGESAQKENAWSQARNTITQFYEGAKDFLGISDSQKAIKYLNSRKWFDDLVNAKNKKEENKVISDIMGKLFPIGFETIKEGVEE